MNTIYRIVWNATTGKWIVASELAKGRKKASRTKLLALATSVLLGTGAFSTVSANETCKTADGQAGNVDTSGTCVVDTFSPKQSSGVATRSVSIQAVTNPIAVTEGSTAVRPATGNPTLAGGSGAQTAVGAGAYVDNSGGVALGGAANSYGSGGIAIGVGSTAAQGGGGGIAIGEYTVTGGPAYAGASTTRYTNGGGNVALGGSAIVNVTTNTSGAEASVALGASSYTDRLGVVSVGSSKSGDSFNRQIVNLANGTEANDAINLSQLSPVVDALGGGAAVNADGTITAPSYTIQGRSVSTVANAFAGLDSAVTANTTNIANNATAIAALQADDGGNPYVAVNGANDGTDSANASTNGANSHNIAIGSNAAAGGSTAANQRAIAIGSGATAAGNLDIALGSNASANSGDNMNLGQSSLAIGTSATSVGGGNTVIGQGATASNGNASTTLDATAVGNGATVSGNGGVALGYGAKASANDSTAIGAVASATATNSVAVGWGSVADRADSVSVGSVGKERQIVNVAAGTAGTDAVNFDQLNSTAGSVASAIGGGSTVNADGTISAPSYTVQGNTVHSIGDAVTNLDGAVTTNTNNITAINNQLGDIADGTVGLVKQDAATGNITMAADTGGNNVNIAGTAGARTLTGVAAGDVSATSTEAVNGSQLFATNQQVTANTNNIKTNTDNITTLTGRVSTNEGDITTINNQLTELSSGGLGLVQQDATTGNLTVASGKGGTQMDISGSSGPRVLTGVANGTNDTDAVSIAQLKAVGLVDRDGNALGALVYDDASLASATLGGSNGTLITNLKAGAIAAGSMDAVNGGQLYAMQQNFQSQYDFLNNQYTNLNNQFQDLSGKVDGIVEGGGSGGGAAPADPSMPGSGDGSTQVGNGAAASGDNSTATGSNSSASGDNSTATGGNSVASGNNSTANGANSSASGDSSTAIGSGSKASGNGSTAVGANASASGENSTALGANSNASGSNSVALGNGSVADRDNSVSVGSAGNERQITNVAAGTAPTDAVNVSQLQQSQDWSKNYTDQQVNAVNQRVTQVGRVADAGVAGAMAMANIPQPYAAGQSGIGAGVGSFRGQSALAVGVSTITPGGRWVLRGSVMTNTQGDAGIGVGALMVW